MNARTVFVVSCGMYSVMQRAVVVDDLDGRAIDLVQRALVTPLDIILAESRPRRWYRSPW